MCICASNRYTRQMILYTFTSGYTRIRKQKISNFACSTYKHTYTNKQTHTHPNAIYKLICARVASNCRDRAFSRQGMKLSILILVLFTSCGLNAYTYTTTNVYRSICMYILWAHNYACTSYTYLFCLLA